MRHTGIGRGSRGAASVAFLLVVAAAWISSSGGAVPAPPALHTKSPAPRVAIDFRLFGPIVLVPVRVNGSGVLWFELDTGFENSVIDPKWIGPLGLKAGRKQRVDAPGGSVERATITGATLELPGLQITNQVFSAIDQSAFAPFYGHAVDGILGFDFIERFVTEIDYEAQRLRLYDAATYRYDGAGSSVPIDVSTRQPYVEARVLRNGEAPAQGRFEIDTGSMDALNLNTPFAASHRIPGPGARAVSVRGRSLGGETSGLLTRVEGLELGNIRIDMPIAGIVADDVDRAGQISGEILRRFRVIVDYSRGLMILEKNRNFAEPFDTDMLGIFLVAAGAQLEKRKVFLVIPNTPADRAGIRVGDLLASVDSRDAGEYPLNELRRMFRQAGLRYRLTFRRGARAIELDARLEPLL
jgi:Aspartyl protease/PDZ domain